MSDESAWAFVYNGSKTSIRMSGSNNSHTCSSRWPPKLDNKACYETWKHDINIWRELSDLPKPKWAMAIHLSLSGRCRSNLIGIMLMI